ncbi:hypothetical protein [Sunxiuqinia indica]|uniref:hypothetical protein n=1 Tax=Sunxiuqinia indica TaxID=2692584 RepID=UPI00135A31C5|nr:hypothetical protein [Sunxiuqinia indica]
MRDTNGQNNQPLTAEEVINGFAKLTDIAEVRTIFTNLFLEWVASDTETDQSCRSSAVMTYKLINELLSDIENYQERSAS